MYHIFVTNAPVLQPTFGYTPVYGTLSLKIDKIVDSSQILDEIVDSSKLLDEIVGYFCCW